MAAAREVLAALAPDLELEEHVFGGAAILATGDAAPRRDARRLPRGRRGAARRRRPAAVRRADVRPEQGLHRTAQARSTSTRTCARRAGATSTCSSSASCVGGLYYGAKGTREDGTVFDTLRVPPEPGRADRAARVRARARTRAAASPRSTRPTCWRRRGCGGGSSPRSRRDYPDVELEHMLVDTAAMQLVTDAASAST